LTLAELRTEFFARGFDYLTTTRANTFLQAAQDEICEMHPWPFLESTAIGTSPLTISDLRQVLSVVDTTNDVELWGIDRREIVTADPSVNDSGPPTQFYLDSDTVIAWPGDAVSLAVRYLKVANELSDDDDEPDTPSRYDEILIDGAVIRAYKDSDNMEAAA
jgi:hypothetical protein